MLGVSPVSKYTVPDDHWDEDDDSDVDDVSPLTTLDDHEVSVIHDPYEGRRTRYRVSVHHDLEDSPVAVLAYQGRWKGNYWRDERDPIDWADVPTAVQLTVARVVDGATKPDDLDPGDRYWSNESLFEDGGRDE